MDRQSIHPAGPLAVTASRVPGVATARVVRLPDASVPWVLRLALILAIGPFVVRRIVLLGDDNYVHWLAIDYVARCISIAGAVLGLSYGVAPRAYQRAGWLVSFRVFILLFAVQNAEQVIGYPILQHYLRWVEISSWPHIADPALRAFDLSFGLALVAFSEELVFRRFLFAVIERSSSSRHAAVLVSAAAFALVHFTSGIVDTMANAFVHGVLLGLAYGTTRRLSVCVLSHYLIDLCLFSVH